MPSRRQFLVGSAAGAALSRSSAAASNTISLRTHEWYGDKLEQFPFPEGWRVSVYHSKIYNAPALTAAQIRQALQNPIGTKPLREIAAGKTTAAIAVADMCRAEPTNVLVPHIVAELNAAGIKDQNILFVIAHGQHMMMNPSKVARKIGADAMRRHPWINHNAWESLVELGKTTHGNTIEADCNFYTADVKITLSGLKRHALPGYGGGPKLCLPGLAGVKTIRFMHAIRTEGRPSTNPDGSPVYRIYGSEARKDMIETARAIGVDFSVQQCFNSEDRQLTKIVAGDIVKAHHEACRYAIPANSTVFAKNGSADILIANCYPRCEQIHENFGWASNGLKDGGTMVLINQYPEGMSVWHYGEGPGYMKASGGGSYFKARDNRRPRTGPPGVGPLTAAAVPGGAGPSARPGEIIVYSEYLTERELSNVNFPPNVIGCWKWADVIERLKKKHTGSSVEVAVYPAVGAQHEVATHDIPPDV